jgi:hypothetical protein
LGCNRSSGRSSDDRANRRTAVATDRAANDSACRAAENGATERILRRRMFGGPINRER